MDADQARRSRKVDEGVRWLTGPGSWGWTDRLRFLLWCRSTGEWPGKALCLLIGHARSDAVLCARCKGLSL